MKTVALIVIGVYFLAMVSNGFEFYRKEYKPYPNQPRYWACSVNLYVKQWLILSIKNSLLSSFIPLPILITLQVATYRAIVKSARQFQVDSNRMRTMKRVRESFCIVILAFFLLTFPVSIFSITAYSILNVNPHIRSDSLNLLYQLSNFFNKLLTLNSCVNSLIYSKIHRRCVRCCWEARRRSLRGRQEMNTTKNYVIELHSFAAENQD